MRKNESKPTIAEVFGSIVSMGFLFTIALSVLAIVGGWGLSFEKVFGLFILGCGVRIFQLLGEADFF